LAEFPDPMMDAGGLWEFQALDRSSQLRSSQPSATPQRFEREETSLRGLGSCLGNILLAVSKRCLGSARGNQYLRKLLVEGARAAFARLNRSQHCFGPWMDQLGEKKHSNVAVVALANKLARIAWAVLTTGQQYRAAT
jgi:hypothetical protein